jgi:hypothetical protein
VTSRRGPSPPLPRGRKTAWSNRREKRDELYILDSSSQEQGEVATAADIQSEALVDDGGGLHLVCHVEYAYEHSTQMHVLGCIQNPY